MRNYIFLFFSLSFIISYSQNSQSIIEDYLNDNHRQYQLELDDVDEFRINKQFNSESLNGKHVYIQQTIQGYPVLTL